MNTRPMQPMDVPAASEIHLSAFQGFFLTFLGRAFLNELYTAILEDPTGIAWVGGDSMEVTGFIAGSLDLNGFYRHLLKFRWLRFGCAAFPAFLKKPSILPRLLRALALPRQILPTPNCATIMSVAVHPAYQGHGLGQALVRSFLKEARQRGAEHVNLSTNARDNHATNCFYQSMGFSLYHNYTTPEGREMNEYIIDLN